MWLTDFQVIPNIIRIMSTASTARSRKRAHDGSRQKVDVINLETTAPVVNTGSQHEALILRGTRTSPIDVEALDDKVSFCFLLSPIKRMNN